MFSAWLRTQSRTSFLPNYQLAKCSSAASTFSFTFVTVVGRRMSNPHLHKARDVVRNKSDTLNLLVKYSKYLFKIYFTNWITLVGILIGTVVTLTCGYLFKLDESPQSFSEFLGELATLPLFFLIYGLIPIVIFLIIICVLDTVCFLRKTDAIILLLLFEWIVISIKPGLWAFDYQYWLWIGLSMSFLVTQYFRNKQIKKIQTDYFKSQSTAPNKDLPQ